jgi:hypothetical protein
MDVTRDIFSYAQATILTAPTALLAQEAKREEGD